MSPRAVAGILLATLAASCGAPAADSAPAPRMPVDVAGEAPSGGRVAVWRSGAAGTLVLFMRGLIAPRTRELARAIAQELIAGCAPPYDIVVVLEPGAAALWPPFREEAGEQLAHHRARRAQCLGGASSAQDASDQISLVMDDRGEVRRDILFTSDPGDDLVVVAYDTEGEALYRAGLGRTANAARAVEIATLAKKALATPRAARAPRGE